MSMKANTVFTWMCTLLTNSQFFMYPMDSDVSLYNLHTICYSSRLKEPLSHEDEDTHRQSKVCDIQYIHHIQFNEERRKKSEYFTVRLTISIDPPLTVSFS